MLGFRKRQGLAAVLGLGLGCSLLVGAPAAADEYSCLRQPSTYGSEATWTTGASKDLRYIVSWAFRDPEQCITGRIKWGGDFFWNQVQYPQPTFPTTWRVSRDGEMTLLSAEFEFPVRLLQSLPNRNLDGYGFDLQQVTQNLKVVANIELRQGNTTTGSLVSASYGIGQVWGDWFSKNQGLATSECDPMSSQNVSLFDFLPQLRVKPTVTVLESGARPQVQIDIPDPRRCIFLVHAAAPQPSRNLSKFTTEHCLSLSEYPFWSGEAPPYFADVLAKPDQLVPSAVDLKYADTKSLSVSVGSAGSCSTLDLGNVAIRQPLLALPSATPPHSDQVTRVGDVVRVITSVDASALSPASGKNLTLFLGHYDWYTKNSSYVSGGWRVTVSGSTWTARYSSGGSLPGGRFMAYITTAINLPLADLLMTKEQRAALEAAARAKAEAEAKAQAEATAKAEAAAKAQADAMAAQAAADLAALATSVQKKSTITCVNIKSKKTKKITAVKPRCPAGWKRR